MRVGLRNVVKTGPSLDDRTGLHATQRGRIGSAAKLLPIALLERVDAGSNGVFVFEARKDIGPPRVVVRPQARYLFRMLCDHVRRFAGIALQVVEFFVVDQRES